MICASVAVCLAGASIWPCGSCVSLQNRAAFCGSGGFLTQALGEPQNIHAYGSRLAGWSMKPRPREAVDAKSSGSRRPEHQMSLGEGVHGDDTTTSGRHRVLGLGLAGVDFIAMVDSYPPADSKVRTQSLEMMGGGNCGNTLVAASRLGLDAHIVTKVGSDSNGRLILDGLIEEGVDTSRVIISDATPSPFAYVIVDREGGTRTCLHTPQTEEILPQEVTPDLLDGVSLVHLDSRHTKGAVALARLANERGIPVLLDAEKDRPDFGELLPLADYLICNKNFPQAFTGRDTKEEALRDFLHQGRAKLVASTLGVDGSMVMTRERELPWAGYDDITLPPRCPVEISTTYINSEIMSSSGNGAKDGEDLLCTRASSWPVQESDIVDTTGAGDSFIAAFIYGIVNRQGIGRMLALASLVAARKLSQAGARKGVPTLEHLKSEWPDLLATTVSA